MRCGWCNGTLMFIERPLRYKDKLFCSSYCRKCGIAYERDENVKPSKKLKIWVKDKKGIEQMPSAIPSL